MLIKVILSIVAAKRAQRSVTILTIISSFYFILFNFTILFSTLTDILLSITEYSNMLTCCEFEGYSAVFLLRVCYNTN